MHLGDDVAADWYLMGLGKRGDLTPGGDAPDPGNP